MSDLRIAMLHQREGGGSTTALEELMSSLRALGHTVEDLTPEPGAALVDVLRSLAAFVPDVVHAHCFYNALPYENLAEIRASHALAWTLHDVLPVNQFGVECWECSRNARCFGCPALPWWKRWRTNHRTQERARHRRVHQDLRSTLVLPSQWMARRIAHTELAEFPQVVIPYGLDLAPWRGVAELQAPTPRVLFYGNMYSAQDHRKGLPDLLAAWRQVQAELPAAELRVAGRITEGLLPSTVSNAGETSRSALLEELAAASVVCVPSRGDNLPLAVIEAMAAGRCVVAAKTGGIPELVQDGKTGLLVPAGDPSALAGALKRVLRDRALAQRLGAAGQRRAEALCSGELCARRHIEVYEQLATTMRTWVR
jgi:glycosyltransferase involved in cell wall biosynthesis